ncbi:MAG: efflux RND transporter periplasmic adaptor subunit [Bacteroidota bacterium]
MHLRYFLTSLCLGVGTSVLAADAARPAPVVAAPAAVVSAAPAAPAAAKPAAGDRQEIRAQLSPRRYTTLAAEIGAKISRLPVPEGEAFKQGQTLVVFDCSVPAAQLNKARAALAAAQTTYSANQRLIETGSVGKVEVDVSGAEVTKNRAEVAANAAVLAKCSVPAPYAGRIAEQKVREQQYVQPGQALLEIIDDSVLELEFIAPSHWLAWLKNGYGFQVKIDETNKNYPAKVLRIGARVDPVSQSVKVAAAIDGKFPQLIAGMSGKVLLVPPPSQ